MTAFSWALRPARALGVCAVLCGLGVGGVLIRTLQAWLPDDFVWRSKPGAVYVLKSAGAAAEVAFARRGASSETGFEGRLPSGTKVRLLRVQEDELRRPRLLVRVLDGPRSGERGYVTRWQLRHPGPSSRLSPTPALAISLALALVAGAALWATGVVISERPQRAHSTAPRQAE